MISPETAVWQMPLLHGTLAPSKMDDPEGFFESFLRRVKGTHSRKDSKSWLRIFFIVGILQEPKYFLNGLDTAFLGVLAA